MGTWCHSPLLLFPVFSPWGGTILGTSRTDPLKNPDDIEKIQKTIKTSGIDALVVIGGDGTLSAASEISETGIPLAGIPKTIDNDILWHRSVCRV